MTSITQDVDLTGIHESFSFGGIAERRQRKEVNASLRATMPAAGKSFKEVGRAPTVANDGAGGGPTHRLVDPGWASQAGLRPEDMLTAGLGGGTVRGQNIGDAVYENMTEEQRWQAEESLRRTGKPGMMVMARWASGDLPGAAAAFVNYMRAAFTYIDPAEAHAPPKRDWPILEALRESLGFLPTGETPELGDPLSAFPKSPNPALRRWAQQGGYIDPETDQWIATAEKLAPDHVFPQDLIKKLEGFSDLTPAQQDFLLNYPENFEPLPKSWNSSKQNRLAGEWATTPMGSRAKPEYVARLRGRQEAFREFAESMIQFWRR